MDLIQRKIMLFMIFGIIGIVVSGALSKKYYRNAPSLERMRGTLEGKPMAGVVPVWVSWINIVSFGLLIYGVVDKFF
jgi:hypothetical protein